MYEQVGNGQVNGEVLPEAMTVGSLLKILGADSPAVSSHSVIKALGSTQPDLYGFEDRDVRTQASIIRSLEMSGVDVAAALRQASLANHHNRQAERLRQPVVNASRDPASYRLLPGHVVEMIVRVDRDDEPDAPANDSTNGPTVTQPKTTYDSSEVEKGIFKVPGVDPILQGIRAVVRTMTGGQVQVDAPTEQRILARHPDGSADYAFVRGVVEEAPGRTNDGYLTLRDGSQYDQGTMLFTSIVGADLEALEKADQDRQEFAQPPVRRIEGYPEIQEDRCVSFTDPQGMQRTGYIESIHPDTNTLTVQTETGLCTITANEAHVWPQAEKDERTGAVNIGDILARPDFYRDRHEAFRVVGVQGGIIMTKLISLHQPDAPYAYTFTPESLPGMWHTSQESVQPFHDEYGIPENAVRLGLVTATFRDPATGILTTGNVISEGGYPYFLDVTVRKTPVERQNSSDPTDPYHRISVTFGAISSVNLKEKSAP